MPTYTLPDLGYDYAALEPALSAEILELHHGKHHAAYVSALNTVLGELDAVRSSGDFAALPGLEQRLAFNLSGHVLHSIYWRNLAPGAGGRPEGELAAAVDDSFGTFEALRAELSAATVSVMGSGWGVLAWEPFGQQLLVTQVQDHQDNTALGSVPLLVLDAWEHAYYLQYQNRRADYVEAVWGVVDWADVGRRFDDARRLRDLDAMNPVT